jgi:HlyD family secretion protein
LKKKNKSPLIVIIVVIVFVAVGVFIVQKSIHKTVVLPRTVAARRAEMIVKVSETGTIEPIDKVDVKSKVAGRLLSIPIVEGEHVVKGQLIALVDRTQIDPQIASTRAQLDNDEAHLAQTIAQYSLTERQDQMAIQQAQASLVSAQTHLGVVKEGARPQELAQDQEAVDRAKITLDDATRNQRRKAQLLTSGFIPQSDFDTAQVAVDTAASNLETAQQALALAQAGARVEDVIDAQSGVDSAEVALATAKVNATENTVKKFDIDQARATVAQTTNDLDQLLVNLSDTTIVAPSSGIVLKKYKEQDEIVQSATTGFSDADAILATLGNRDRVEVGINEVDIVKVSPNARVIIHVDALPNTTFNGTVTSIAPASTNAFDASGATATATTSTIAKFSVKIAFSQIDDRLRPGMTADVDIISADHKNAVLIPLEGLPFDGNSGSVTVLNAQNKQVQRFVQLGLENDTDAEVLNGLNVGDRVVVPKLSVQRRGLNINGDDSDD